MSQSMTNPQRVPTRRGIFVAVIGLAAGGMALGEWIAHRRVEQAYRQAIETRRRLEVELGEARADRERLTGELAAEQQRVQQLTARLSDKETELQAVVDRLAQEERIMLELQGRLLSMQHQFDRVQGELAITLQAQAASASTPDKPVVRLEKVVVRHPTATNDSAAGFEGRVVSFNPQWRFIVVDMGWDVVNIGDVLSIYRHDQLLGQARVERVQEEVCAASLLSESLEAEIQVNDLVRVL